MSDIALALSEIEQLRKSLRAVEGKQVFSKGPLEALHRLAGLYYGKVRNVRAADSENAKRADVLFTELHELSRKHPSKQKCLDVLTEAKQVLIKLEGASITQRAGRAAGSPTPIDDLIISTLVEVCPSAAGAYRQALRDLMSADRESWRGPATDLREALRETLDVLAPDGEVVKMEGYKPEPEAKRPTMRQKVRFILKNRGMSSGQIAAPEDAVKGVEEMLGGLTRSVYTRSSVSTHTPTSRKEVVTLHSYVRVVMSELLEVPIH